MTVANVAESLMDEALRASEFGYSRKAKEFANRALRAERRATVERLDAAFTEQLVEGSPSDTWSQGEVVKFIDAILDAEAQR